MMATALFYLLGIITVMTTLLAVTRKNPVHAVIYLINSFFALALLFYLLGAPLIAAWEIVVYAGAIMILFLFVIMVLQLSPTTDVESGAPGLPQWVPILLLAGGLAVCTLLLTGLDPSSGQGVALWYASPRNLGYALFKEYALAVEIASFQLLFAVAGAFYLARPQRSESKEDAP